MQPMLYISAAAGLRFNPGSALMDSSVVGLTTHAAANADETDDIVRLGYRNAWESWNTSTRYVQPDQSFTSVDDQC